MPKLPKGMFSRKGRPGWYKRLYQGGRERWVSLGTAFAKACDRARALEAGITLQPLHAGDVSSACERWLESYIRRNGTRRATSS